MDRLMLWWQKWPSIRTLTKFLKGHEADARLVQCRSETQPQVTPDEISRGETESSKISQSAPSRSLKPSLLPPAAHVISIGMPDAFAVIKIGGHLRAAACCLGGRSGAASVIVPIRYPLILGPALLIGGVLLDMPSHVSGIDLLVRISLGG